MESFQSRDEIQIADDIDKIPDASSDAGGKRIYAGSGTPDLARAGCGTLRHEFIGSGSSLRTGIGLRDFFKGVGDRRRVLDHLDAFFVVGVDNPSGTQP